MDNSEMAILSMEPVKWIITLHNNYCLILYSISCRHSRNAATASNQMLHVLLSF